MAAGSSMGNEVLVMFLFDEVLIFLIIFVLIRSGNKKGLKRHDWQLCPSLAHMVTILIYVTGLNVNFVKKNTKRLRKA